MFSTEDFILKYNNYSDEELFEVYSNINKYSDEAKKALFIVITKHGGLERLIENQKRREMILIETQRISAEVDKLYSRGIDIFNLKKSVTSDILSAAEMNKIIDTQFSFLKMDTKNKEIGTRTILGSIFGGVIASIFGGILIGLLLIYTARIYAILVFGLILLCYGIIRLCTKQSSRNIVVLITTIISVIIALLLGQLMYNIVGYQG